MKAILKGTKVVQSPGRGFEELYLCPGQIFVVILLVKLFYQNFYCGGQQAPDHLAL